MFKAPFFQKYASLNMFKVLFFISKVSLEHLIADCFVHLYTVPIRHPREGGESFIVRVFLLKEVEQCPNMYHPIVIFLV